MLRLLVIVGDLIVVIWFIWMIGEYGLPRENLGAAGVIGAIVLCLLNILVLARMDMKRTEGRIRRMLNLWLDAKEEELKKRAGKAP